MTRRLLSLALGLLLLAALHPGAARAWDVEGDRVAAQLAYERLTPETRTRVDQLLGGGVQVAGCEARRLDDAADFVSCLRSGPTKLLRDIPYDAIALCGPSPPSQWCRDGRCASAALKRAIAELKDPSTSPTDRAVALETTVYLVAELHQPLHAADNGDRSGERIRVVLPGALKARETLYGVWNDDVVASAIGTAEAGLPYVRALADASGEGWIHGDVDDWVAETHDVALHDVYGKLPTPPACNKLPDKPEWLGPDYFSQAVPVARTQLAKAGVRLAVVLNAALGGGAPSPPTAS